jgi:uncharacterized membrane protein
METLLFPERRRLVLSALAGLVAGGVGGRITVWQVSTLVAWCAAAAMFLVAAWATMLPADGRRTRAIAMREDETRVMADLVVLSACVASLVGVGLILLKASGAEGSSTAVMTGLGVLSVVLAWAMVHTVFTLRYADLYYTYGGGIDFNQEDDPDYRDFAYLAFTIGMTYQVSDTNLRSRRIRRVALRHALLSFVFGTAIIAVTINVVAGLAR